MKKRNDRHESIRQIVRTKKVRTQKALADELQKLGYNCTQATVSRDITDLGLQKISGGMYVLQEDLHLHRMVSDLVRDISFVGNLVIVKAAPGTASGIAAALDDASLEGVVGSVAGDDTVLVVCESPEGAQVFIEDLEHFRETMD